MTYSRPRATKSWTTYSKSEVKRSRTAAPYGPLIFVKWDGECSRCGAAIRKGERARFNVEHRSVRHPFKCKPVL